MDNLYHYFTNKTVIIVAHRLSTVKNADKIIVLKKGEIVEQGTHQQLVGNKADYFKLVKNQLELGDNYMKYKYLLLLLIFFPFSSKSQVIKPSYLQIDAPDSTRKLITNGLDSLFAHINVRKLPANISRGKDSSLTMSILNSYRGLEYDDKTKQKDYFKKQLINCYPINKNDFLISVAYMALNQDNIPQIKNIITLNAHVENKLLTYSLPLNYLTADWKIKKIGNINYHYAGSINANVANEFNTKNSNIAKKLNLPVEQFEFYLCDNYQQILALLGYTYDADSNGRTRDGYGVDANTIFSIMHNEDFSHDLVHYYIAKIRTNTRNSFAEEGLAYYWGNAYYTDNNGLMISQRTLLNALNAYLKNHTNVTLLGLFKQNPNIFDKYAKEISVRSVIAGMICAEVEKQKGVPGIKELINCGQGENNFYKVLNKLINLTDANFDQILLSQIKLP